MARVKKGQVKHSKHKKHIKLATGMRGRISRCYTLARKLSQRAHAFAYVGRKQKKRDYRAKFIAIINTFCRENNRRYSEFICQFNKSKYFNTLDRKSLALLIQNDYNSALCVFNEVFSL
ncbi:50S ribosomal protein L20 [bacterium AB1]|nr:50S ribosomal protein L20 [bacterium AB1]